MLSIAYPDPTTLFAAQLKAFSLSPRHRQAIRAWRYYDGSAYKSEWGAQFWHPFLEWDEQDKGPRPVIMPVPSRIVDLSAQFLFAECPRFLIGDEDTKKATKESDEREKETGRRQKPKEQTLQTHLDDILRMNQMEDKYLPEARAASIEGETYFKFAWTPQVTQRPVAIQTLRVDEVLFFRDEMDADIVQKARVQVKYRDNDGQWWIYREEWTAEKFIEYDRLLTKEHTDVNIFSQFKAGEWPHKTKPNPFGVIPITQIYNKKVKHDWNGYGDYWALFDKFDQYNYTNWLEHYSNQMDADSIIAIINADYDGVLKPGKAVKIKGQEADIKKLIGENNLRADMRQYKLDVRKEIFDAAGYDDVDPAVITNKGNLTRAVWEMTYSKSLHTTREKQRHWGECGLCLFLATMLLGLSRLNDARARFPALSQVKEDDPDSYTPEIVWPDLFRVTPEERSATIKDANDSVTFGFLTRERAVEQVAKAWGIQDVSTLQEELEETHEQLDQRAQAQSDLDLALQNRRQALAFQEGGGKSAE